MRFHTHLDVGLDERLEPLVLEINSEKVPTFMRKAVTRPTGCGRSFAPTKHCGQNGDGVTIASARSDPVGGSRVPTVAVRVVE